MPTTKEVINWVKQTANGWNRVGELGILEILNEVQNMLVQQETHQQLVVVGEDYPVLVTTEDVYSYDIDTTNVPTLPVGDVIWRIDSVLLKVPVNDALRTRLIGEYNIGPDIVRPLEKHRFRGKDYFRYQQVSTFDETPSNKAKVVFNLNPGNTTDDFVLLMYKGCTQLTSESVQLTIPERLHLRVVVPAVVEFISALQNNTWLQAVEMIERKFMKQIRNESNSGEQGVSHSVQRRRL